MYPSPYILGSSETEVGFVTEYVYAQWSPFGKYYINPRGEAGLGRGNMETL